jgi:hypothetical protein
MNAGLLFNGFQSSNVCRMLKFNAIKMPCFKSSLKFISDAHAAIDWTIDGFIGIMINEG